MNYTPGDIVLIEQHPITPAFCGQHAAVMFVFPGPHRRPEFVEWGPDVTWYMLVDKEGQLRVAAHPWLRITHPMAPHRQHRRMATQGLPCTTD